MNKINELKPGDESVVIEALINRVVTGKTNGANRSTYLSMTLQDVTGLIDAKLWNYVLFSNIRSCYLSSFR